MKAQYLKSIFWPTLYISMYVHCKVPQLYMYIVKYRSSICTLYSTAALYVHCKVPQLYMYTVEYRSSICTL